MPYIQCDLAEALSNDQKRALTDAIVEVVHETIGSAVRHINVAIRELPPENVVEGGRRTSSSAAA
jgi:4-oxalocrotonate tautomerase family enzyme